MINLIKKIISYPGSILFAVISIIIISLVMGFYLEAPSYITLLADIIMVLLVAILSLNYECLEMLKSKERITYCKTNEIYYAHAQSITGKTIYAYHPMQNLINIDKPNGENRNVIKEMKRIYEDITNEKIRQYHLFIEVKEYNQLEALISRINFLKNNYPDLIKNKNVPIWVRKCEENNQVFPFHFQITLGDTRKHQNLIFGHAMETYVEGGVLSLNDGHVYNVFQNVISFVKSRFKDGNITDGKINKKIINNLCNDFSISVPESVKRW
jgi:hypothetical protein